MSIDWKPIEELDLVLLMEGKQMVLLNKKRPFVNAYGFICEDTYEEYGEDVHSLWDDIKTDATHYALLTPPQTNQS